ncbi:response regulator transcription factor [Prosthecobacter sp.]|uniref:response regulator transcription factor n=1 Tax=Prosthecobacter sp. TaxID=1965333 RepID=UPI003BAE8D78
MQLARPGLTLFPVGTQLIPFLMAKVSNSTLGTKESPAKELKRRVLIVDDHPIFRDGITQLINHQPDMLVCGGVCSAAQAMSSVEELKPDMLIVDISINGTNGIELIKSIRAQYPALPALMLSSHDENLYAERALRAGARGYIMKAEAPEKVIEAIRRVLSGSLYLSEAIGGRLLDTFLNGRTSNGSGSAVDQLSDRELEIFHALGEGRSTREIALTLFLSVKTVETHRSHIKEKLKVQTAPELIRAAVEWVNSQSNK